MNLDLLPYNCDCCHHNEERIEKIDKAGGVILKAFGLCKHAFHMFKPLDVSCKADNQSKG